MNRMTSTATGTFTYAEYLRLPALLAQQVPRAGGAAHDEQLFIAVHQVHELWFKLMLAELTDARDRMLAGETVVPAQRLRRCRTIESTLLGSLEVLDTMAPGDFRAFRGVLGTASGAQSAQFHEIEALSGRTDVAPVGLGLGAWPSPAERAALDRRLLEPSLWDAFLAVLRAADLACGCRAERMRTYDRIGRDGTAVGELMDALLEYDRGWSLWRERHVRVVERQLGGERGTGGSSGAAYLRVRAAYRFFPELWEARGDR
ncbi:tryptophan 2,3-dioxygenase family protein [Streptomyces sp. NPDC093094]|uniref:tryptophan 2,3-dioxygenase family protein n=1 Tax=Streptomyces sp. NPDC093094 TaxID=3366026 RepID=UPI003809AA7F